VREEVLDNLAARTSFAEPLQPAASAGLIGERMKVSAEGVSARLTIGPTFIAEIDLKP